MKYLEIKHSDKLCLVDDEDFERLSKFTWIENSKQSSIGRSCFVNRVDADTGIVTKKSTRIALASEIMHQPFQMFDHIDTNYLNNQKYNFRPCNQQQNSRNRSKRKGTSSQYKGVSYSKRHKKWAACITIRRGRNTNLGLFNTELEAAKIYNESAIKFFKEFANLNRTENGEII